MALFPILSILFISINTDVGVGQVLFTQSVQYPLVGYYQNTPTSAIIFTITKIENAGSIRTTF